MPDGQSTDAVVPENEAAHLDVPSAVSQPSHVAEASGIIMVKFYLKLHLPEIVEADDDGSEGSAYISAVERGDDDDDLSYLRSRQSLPTPVRDRKTLEELKKDGQALLAQAKERLAICGFPYLDVTDLRDDLKNVRLIEQDKAAQILLVAIPVRANEWHPFADYPTSYNTAMGDMIDALIAGRSVNSDGEIEQRDDEVDIYAHPLADRDLPEGLSIATIMARVRDTECAVVAPHDGESEDAWLARLLLTEDRLVNDLWDRWLSIGCDHYNFKQLEPPSSVAVTSQAIDFLVDGLVQRGVLHMFVAAAGTGKSTALAELSVGLASGEDDRMWLGQRINACPKGTVVYIAGEDAKANVDHWRTVLGDSSRRLLTLPQDSRPLSEIIGSIEKMPSVPLVIIDSARNYLTGGEVSDDAVNDFLLLIGRLIRNTGAAVILTHHLTKDAKPTKLDDFKSMTRGLQLWIDRARVVVGMRRRGDQIVVGIVKHNVPPQYPMMQERAFNQDADGLRLVPVQAPPSQEAAPTSADQLLVLQAIRRLNAAAQTVFKTGKTGLYALARDHLVGLSRDATSRIVDDLVGLGVVLTDAAGGLLAIPVVPAGTSVMPERAGDEN